MNTMVNLCDKMLFLTLLLLMAGCHLSMPEKMDYFICDSNSPYLWPNSSGTISINYKKLKELVKCTMKLIPCDNCKVTFQIVGHNFNKICSANSWCQCHLRSFSDNNMEELRCDEQRCSPMKITTSLANPMVITPSYPTSCKFSTTSSHIFIDVCQSINNLSGMNISYVVDKFVDVLNYAKRPFLEHFQNFTMCVDSKYTYLNLGDEGYIHMSRCSGICKLVLESCSMCRIHFNVIISPLAVYRYTCLKIKITDKYKRGKYIQYSIFQSQTLNFTTFSKSAIIQTCHGSSETGIKMFYKVIAKRDIIHFYNGKDTTFRFPPFYPSSNEYFEYDIRMGFWINKLQIIFTNYLSCSDCYVIGSCRNSTFRYDSLHRKRVYVCYLPVKLKYFTGTINKQSSGFKAELSAFKDFSIQNNPNDNCGTNEFISVSRSIQFRTRKYAENYDCVWVLQSHVEKKYFSLSVVSLLPKSTRVNIHYGNTSDGKRLAILRNNESYYTAQYNAYYIRLQGVVNTWNKLDIYILKGIHCGVGRFQCKNDALCIPEFKRCNGWADCSDNSDEEKCSLIDSRKPYFSYWSYSLIIILTVTAVIILSLCLFFLFVCKKHKCRRTPRQNSSAISSLSGNPNHIRMNLTLEGELDRPPAYDEVMAPSSLQGNINLAFNWSQSNCSETPAMPPTYQEYMREISSTDNVDSRENSYEIISDNTEQQTLSGSAAAMEDSEHWESTNRNNDQSVPTALTTEIDPLGNSLEISQPVIDANVNCSGEVANYSNGNICMEQDAVNEIMTSSESCRFPKTQEATNISEREITESDVESSNKQAIGVLSEQLSNLDNFVYI